MSDTDVAPESVPNDTDQVEDFDAYWSTVERKAKAVRVYGVTVTLPPSLPLQFELEAKRLQGSTSGQDVQTLVGLLFGADALDQWVANGMDVEEFGVLLMWATVRVSQPSSTMDLAEAHQLYREQEAARASGKAPKAPKGSKARKSAGKRISGRS